LREEKKGGKGRKETTTLIFPGNSGKREGRERVERADVFIFPIVRGKKEERKRKRKGDGFSFLSIPSVLTKSEKEEER